MSEGGIVYLGLCVRYQPPIIGVHYKHKASDTKKKVYTILLQKLVLHPDPQEAAQQLYREHPHILKQDKIPKFKIAELIAKIQMELGLGEEQYEGEYEGDEFEESGEREEERVSLQRTRNEPVMEVQQKEQVVPKKRPNFNMDALDSNHPLNRSL